MPIEVNLKFRKKDMDSVATALRKFSKLTAKMPKEIVTWGGIKILNSLEKSTKTAKTTRKIFVPKKSKEKEARGGEAILWGAGRIFPNSWKMFYVQFFDYSGKEQLKRIWAASKEHARHFPMVKIWNSGIAKRSWSWARWKLWKKNMVNGSSGVIKKYVKTSKIQRPFEYGISIENNLRYIKKAFKVKGKFAVNTAMSRAAKGMMGQMEKKLFKSGFVK